MPPEGFDTVTLPTDVIDTLDDIGREELVDPSRSAVVRMLISDYRASGSDDGLPDDLRDQLDRIEAAATTAEDRTGSIQATLEAMGGRR